MKKKQLPVPSPVLLRWGLVIAATTLALFALQSVALWLPYRWAYQFAANAVVWPIVQLGVVVGVGLLGLALWYKGWRAVGLTYVGIMVICLIPTVQMLGGLHRYGGQHDVRPPFNTMFHMLRIPSAPDEPQVKYGRGGLTDLYLSSYLTDRVDSPAVVYVHGGGWSGGSRTENSEFFRWLNAQGYHVFSIDYRLARENYASWRDGPSDVACALAWLNTNASKYTINKSNVTLMGDSAGGQIAMRAAYGMVNGDVVSSCGNIPLAPLKVVGIVPAVDARELYDDPVLGPTSRENISRYLGGTPTTARAAYDDASIITHVRAGLPSTLIINAERDVLVSPRSGVALAEALDRAGVYVEQYTLPYAVHSYWINPGGYQNQTSRTLIKRFLEP